MAKLDTLATVVDTCTFLPELARGEALLDGNPASAEGNARSISDLLVDVLLPNKADLVSGKTCAAVEAVLRRLTRPQRPWGRHGVVNLDAVLATGLFDPQLATQTPEDRGVPHEQHDLPRGPPLPSAAPVPGT